ncbi:hypothetical protein [Amycolatopsis sp. NPDC054798]
MPTAAETAEKIDRAQRALREVRAPDTARAAEEAQAAELHRRNTVDAAEAAARGYDDTAVTS